MRTRWQRRAGWLLLLPGLLWASLAGAVSPRLLEIERGLRAQPEHALAAIEQALPSLQGVDRIAARLLQAQMQVDRGETHAMLGVAGALDGLVEQGGGNLAQAAAGLVRAQALARTGPAGRADRALGDALRLLPADAPPWLRLRFVAAQASLRYQMGRLEEAVDLGQQAILLADAAAPDWQRASQRSSLAWTLVAARQLQRAEQVADEAMAIARQSGDALALSGAFSAAGAVYNATGRSDDELRVSREAIALAHQAGATHAEAIAIGNLADTHLSRGDFETALQLAREALPLARRLKDPASEAVALVNAGLALISMHRVDEGLPLVREGLVVQERSGALPDQVVTQQQLGLALQRAGRLKEAWAALNDHRRLADEVFRRDQQQAVLELQESFDAERRQRELALRETENGLQQALLQQRAQEQRLWALALALGLLVLVAVVVLLRRLHDSNARLRDANTRLALASERDPLTGLANRRHFVRLMQDAPVPFAGALLLVDLDHFKRVNDSHGHAVGDSVLVEVARRLRETVRESDPVVRWGGEEFLLLGRGLDAAATRALATRVLHAVADRPVEVGNRRVALTTSVGFAAFPLAAGGEGLDWTRAVDVVDRALYLAKDERNAACGVHALPAEGPSVIDAPGPAVGESAAPVAPAGVTRFSGPPLPLQA